MFYNHLNNPNRQRIAAMYGNDSVTKSEEINFFSFTDENIGGAIGLTKADEFDLEKGRTAMPLGSHATWAGKDYLKTASGWKPVGKLRGNVKANHDHLHNNEDKDKDHHTMTMDAGKMSADEWTAKHGGDLHAKYKAVHDFLHKEKGGNKEDAPLPDGVIGKTKSGKHILINKNADHESYKDFTAQDHRDASDHYNDRRVNNNLSPKANDRSLEIEHSHTEAAKKQDDHGIEVGKTYNHDRYGKVKVTNVEKNEGDKKDKISHIVHFEHGSEGDIKISGKESQGINGFKDSTTGDNNSDIPDKVKEHFESIPTDTNFSFVNSKGRIWRRDNKDGKITDHSAVPSYKLPGGEDQPTDKAAKQSESDEFNKLTSSERALYDRAKTRFPSLDIHNINSLTNKIAELSGGNRKLEHFAEALMYDHGQKDKSDDSKHFGKIDPSDIITGLKNPNYGFPNLERLDEVGILPKETRDEMKQASNLFKKIGELDNRSKSLLTSFQSRILEDKSAKEQLVALSSVVENAEKLSQIDKKFNSSKKLDYVTHIAQAMSHEVNKIEGTTGVDHEKSSKLVKNSIAAYKKAPATRQAKMKKDAEDNIKMHELYSGIASDETEVHAGKEFLKRIS